MRTRTRDQAIKGCALILAIKVQRLMRTDSRDYEIKACVQIVAIRYNGRCALILAVELTNGCILLL